MASILDRIPAFALPFVTRSLRGGRGKRFAALSLGLALLTLLFGVWVGLGRGDVARDARVTIGIEQPIYVREQQEFVIIRTNPDTLPGELLNRQEQARQRGAMLIVEAARAVGPVREENTQLYADVLALAQRSSIVDPNALVGFSWGNPYQVAQLESIVAREGEPEIIDYERMTGVDETLRLLAMLSGGLLFLLATVAAPLLVALQQATERHENTLQPLSGTALGAHELIVGLACGPLAVVTIFAAPLTGLFVLAALATGELAALALLPMLAATTLGLVFGAQLLGHLVGTNRTPGLIGVVLLGMLGALALSSMGMAAGFDQREVIGLPALLPQAGVLGLLGEFFGDPWRAAALGFGSSRFDPTALDLFVPALVGALGAALLGLLAVRALTRHLEGRATLLDASEALFGALVCIVMVNVAIPMLEIGRPFHQLFGLPTLALPFLLLVMARVPVGDVPTKLRRLPLVRLVGEFMAWVMLEVLVAALRDGTLAGLHPMSLVGIGWCALVLVMLAARMVATPSRIAGHVWALFCFGVLPFAYGVASVWAFEPGATLMLFEAPPALTFGSMALFVWVPMSLLRHLRRHVAVVE